LSEERQRFIRETTTSIDTLLDRIINDEKIPYRSDLIKTLSATRKVMSHKRANPKHLGRMIFGIYRVVTDDSTLELSLIGQELLALAVNLREVKKMIELGIVDAP
jgi:metal-responsive CopG/Arc/MetJ family transcriptional regulator